MNWQTNQLFENFLNAIKKKSALIGKGEEQEVEIVSKQYQKIRLKERSLWKLIKKRYESINAT